MSIQIFKDKPFFAFWKQICTFVDDIVIKSDKLETEKDIVRTADGKFIGLRESSGGLGDCAVFRGIVYARYGRFRLPELICYGGGNASGGEHSAGAQTAFDATSYGCLCPQNLSHLERQLGRNAGLKMEEGKLCLSVTVPCSALEGKEKLPVMVWIHGGSYLTGGSEDHRYDVCELSARGNVVVVKISYRLGALGYLWLKDVSGSTSVENGDRLDCNLGLEDQKAALRWVRRHISSFGGDPGNITVFGQSAGAHSIASLIATADSLEPGSNYPLFGGEILFHKTILQSAPLGITVTPSEASRVTRRFLKELSMSDGDSKSHSPVNDVFKSCIDGSMPLERILAAQDRIQHIRMGMTFMPVLPDNMRIPEASTAKSIESGGSVRGTAVGEHPDSGKFSVVIGVNRDDASPYARKALGPLWHTPLRHLMTKLLTDKVFRKPMLSYVKRLEEAGIDVHSYCFRWAPEDSPLGCCHSIELPFLLGHYEDWLTAEMLQGMTRKEFIDNRFLFQNLWTGFAHTSDSMDNVCMGDSDSIDFISMKL